MLDQTLSTLVQLVVPVGALASVFFGFRQVSRETAAISKEAADRYAAVQKESADRYAAVQKETAERYAAVTDKCAAIQKECKEDYKELNEKIYKLMLHLGIK